MPVALGESEDTEGSDLSYESSLDMKDVPDKSK